MLKYIQALVAVLIVGGAISYGFWVWKERTFATTAEARLNLMEEMEKNGLPYFDEKDLKGVLVKSDAFPGKLVLVNFWASWCAPCLEEFPSMLKLLKAFDGKIVLLAINEDADREEIDPFLKSFPEIESNPNVHVIWDEKKTLLKMFEVDRLPESFLAGIDGKLVTKIVGSINWYSEESKQYIAELINGKNPNAQTPNPEDLPVGHPPVGQPPVAQPPVDDSIKSH